MPRSSKRRSRRKRGSKRQSRRKTRLESRRFRGPPCFEFKSVVITSDDSYEVYSTMSSKHPTHGISEREDSIPTICFSFPSPNILYVSDILYREGSELLFLDSPMWISEKMETIPLHFQPVVEENFVKRSELFEVYCTLNQNKFTVMDYMMQFLLNFCQQHARRVTHIELFDASYTLGRQGDDTASSIYDRYGFLAKNETESKKKKHAALKVIQGKLKKIDKMDKEYTITWSHEKKLYEVTSRYPP